MAWPKDIRTRRLLIDTDDPAARFHGRLRYDEAAILAIDCADALRADTDDPDTLIVPALANAHDHGRGLKPLAYGAEDHAVEAWVPATYTLPKVDPYLIAASAFARMARSGIACVVHCHLSRAPDALIAEADAVSRAARDVGMRVAFVVPLRDRNRLGYAPDEAVLAHVDPADRAAVAERWLKPIPPIEEQLASVARIADACESATFSVQYGPVGVEWCSDRLLREIAARSAADGRRVHMHLLESQYQRRWADREYPQGIVAHLDALGLLSPKLTVAHATWLRPEEGRTLAAHGVTVSVNTSSNLRLRSGIAPVPDMHAARLDFAIGLDALALDDDDDILRELRLAWLIHRGWGFEEKLTRADMLRAACRHGARVVHDRSGAGTLRAGAPPDFVVIDFAKLAADLHTGLHDPLDVLLTRAHAGHVRSVVVAGRTIVEDGRVLGIDEPSLQKALRGELARAAPELIALRPLLRRFQVALGRFYGAGGHQ